MVTAVAGDRISATRPRDLLVVAVGAAVASALLVRLYYGTLPSLQWFVPLSLLLLAVAELSAGQQLRARIRRRPGAPPVQPLVAARMLALAKASSQVGAGMLGVWAGLLLYTVPRRDYLAAAGSDTRTGVLGVVTASALVAAGLWLEYCCRAPRPPDDVDRDPTSPDGPNGLGLPG